MEIILALATKSSATSSAASAALGPPHATLLPLVRLLYESVQLALHVEQDDLILLAGLDLDLVELHDGGKLGRALLLVGRGIVLLVVLLVVLLRSGACEPAEPTSSRRERRCRPENRRRGRRSLLSSVRVCVCERATERLDDGSPSRSASRTSCFPSSTILVLNLNTGIRI